MTKAEEAILNYVNANSDIKDITRQIGKKLFECAKAYEARTGFNVDEDYEYHLAIAYRIYKYRYNGYGEDIGDAETFLFEACEHCYAAHKLVEARKKLKLTFGSTKRQITIIGKKLQKTQ